MSSALGEPDAPAGESADLVRRFVGGEPRATRTVLERVARVLAFRGYSIPAEERRDLAQEVVTQVWIAAGRPSFDAEGGFWGFVEVVAARRCIDWQRTRKRSDPLDDVIPDGRANPLEAVLDREQAQLAHATLARLPLPCRELIYLHAGLMKTYDEIAQLLGRSEGALRVQMFRCLKQARTILAEMTEAPRMPSRETEGSP